MRESYSQYLSRFFEGKIQKLSVDLALGCPNRDGTLGRGGCTYCNNKAFSPLAAKNRLSVSQQLNVGREFFRRKYPRMRYLAYFQSYTSTPAPVSKLMGAYREALAEDDVAGIVIGTRPDCLPDELLAALKTLPKPVFIELGAESSHDSTLALVNRCHDWACTEDAVRRAHDAGFPVGLHFILGLPGETPEMMLETVRRINTLPGVHTVKFHHLQILENTTLARQWCDGSLPAPLHSFTPETYALLCLEILDILNPDIVVERFLAQAPPEMVINPKWGLKNYQFGHLLEKLRRSRGN